jgi:hypothetical protein
MKRARVPNFNRLIAMSPRLCIRGAGKQVHFTVACQSLGFVHSMRRQIVSKSQSKLEKELLNDYSEAS